MYWLIMELHSSVQLGRRGPVILRIPQITWILSSMVIELVSCHPKVGGWLNVAHRNGVAVRKDEGGTPSSDDFVDYFARMVRFIAAK